MIGGSDIRRLDEMERRTAQQTDAWPDGVIARYLTLGGATVDLTERSGFTDRTEPTETHAACGGCPATLTVDWGWSGYADEYNQPQPEKFDEGGKKCTPEARAWAQSHAERCRAMPRPDSA